MNINLAQLLFTQNKYTEAINDCHSLLAIHRQEIEAIKLIAKSFIAIRKDLDPKHMT